MTTKGIIYDLDGVIVDTAKYHYKGWKKLADVLGVPFDEIRNEKLKGVSRRESLISLLGHVPSEEEIRKWCDLKNSYYLESIRHIDRSEILPGAIERLEEFDRAGDWKQALASSSKNSKRILGQLDITDYFDAIVDGNDIEKTKPDPEVFVKAAERLGLSSDQVVVVEDAEAGVRAAKTAGMRTIGIGSPDVLGEADVVVRDLSGITLADVERLFETNGSKRRLHRMTTKAASKDWLIEESAYTPEKELYWETIYALSNGYMAARGALDENHACPQIRSYFGTYISGIFDKYRWDYQAIVNVADFFDCAVRVNGELVEMTRGKIENYSRYLDMYNGVLVRRFTWTSPKGESTEFEITRFISRADAHLAVQHYRIRPLNHDGMVTLTNTLDGNVSNIDFHVSGYQLRDEKYFFIADEHEAKGFSDGASLVLNTKTTKHRICELFRLAVTEDGRPVSPEAKTETDSRLVRHHASIPVKSGHEYRVLKSIAVYTSNDRDGEREDLVASAGEKSAESIAVGYQALLEAHAKEWNRCWESADIRITGDGPDAARDQRNVRFNIFHLIQMGNKANPYVNIGSRGLTSEMHYGNCFWDTEIFIMPFFIYTDPDAARALVQYRHLTLPEARAKAKSQWLNGAMYPWMSSYPGKEQADYWEYANIAVHIVSDVVYGLMHYFDATHDTDFMLDCGLEILVETARFWASRVDYSESRKAYVLNLVKGPDEYGIVNNNTYTNWNARWNLRQAVKMVRWAGQVHPDRLAGLAARLGFVSSELDEWTKIADGMFINYDAERNLYIEDDSLLDKKPIDLKKLKPGRKITTEMGHPWDMLLRLKIVKQADVLLLMFLHRNDFTREQVEAAYRVYEPITLHDSSLSYNTHSVIASELGLSEKSEEYFQQTARLDLEDVMENVFLGIHAANAGGTWQCVVNGFGGMRWGDGKLAFNPALPGHWKSLEFKVCFRGNMFRVTVKGEQATLEHVSGNGRGFRIMRNEIIGDSI